MRCDDLTDLIEPWTAGELTPPAEAVAHVEGCAHCVARLALARQLDRLLAARAGVKAPTQFSSAVLGQVRREWWQAEEHLDRWFNTAVAAALLLVAAGIWLLFDRSGLAAVTSDTLTLVGTGVTALVRQMAQSLPLYAGATALLITALLIWRWTDGDLSP